MPGKPCEWLQDTDRPSTAQLRDALQATASHNVTHLWESNTSLSDCYHCNHSPCAHSKGQWGEPTESETCFAEAITRCCFETMMELIRRRNELETLPDYREHFGAAVQT